MKTVQLKELLEAGCHFGHKAERWHPKAAAFIYQERDGIHVIDLVKTKAGLEKGAEVIKQMAKEGKQVLFVGTKRQAVPIIREAATSAGAPFVTHRWVGGFLTNWTEVHKNLQKIRRLTEEEGNGTWNKFPKHERLKLSRYLAKLNQIYGGVVQLMSPPDALFVVDIKTEAVAVAEAKKMGMPVIAIVDTNANPELVEYVIPSNDDAVGAVKLIINHIASAYLEGSEVAKKEMAKNEEIKAAQIAADAKKAEEAKKSAAKPEEKKVVKAEEKKEVAKPVEKAAEVKKEAKVEKPKAKK